MTKESWPTNPQIEKPKPEINNSEKEKAEQDIRNETRIGIALIVNDSEDTDDAIKQILKRLESFFKHIDKELLPDEKINEIINSVYASKDIEDKEEMIDSITDAFKPLLDIKINNPKAFEDVQAKAMNEAGGFTEINRLLSYGKDNGIIHIHAPAGKSVEGKFSLYRQGMRDLAKIVNKDPEITTITATSHIVSEHPEMFTIMGFSVREMTPEEKQKHFAAETRKISRAEISREDFLKKFLKK